LRTILTIIVGMLALSLQAQEIYTGAIAISPSQRTNSWRPTNTLAPGDSAKLSITVAQTGSYNGRNYTLHGNPIQHPPISSPPGSIIWRGNYSSLHACNAGNSPGTTTATVTAEWVETGSGGGGSGGSPSIIYGKATGIAQADIPVFSWSFDRRMQYADGTSPITYTVTGSITGRRVSMSPYSVKAISGELSVTNNTPESTNIRTGKITSTNSAKSKMGVYYGERELARSTNEIAFAKVDLIVPQGPGTNGGTPLPEDRQPAGGTAPATNELNPGTVVLLYGEDQTNRVATTLTLKADPTGGSVTLDQHGLTDLKIYSDEALQEELTLPKTWTNGDTPPSTLYMVGSSSSTNLQSAQGTLDLTYKANLAASGGEYSIKDTVRVTLLPVDIDFIHPATGEMNESRETSEGGYIAIRKDAETPITKLKLHKLDGMPSAEFKLTFSSTKIKIWKDAGRTQAVTSDSTTFPANIDTELFLEGVEKSGVAKDIEIGLKVKIGSTESSAVTTKATVVQEVFPINVIAFIPYRWVDVPFDWLLPPFLIEQVADGDNRSYDPSLLSSFRAKETVMATPFRDLSNKPAKSNVGSDGISIHYDKAQSVPASEQSLSHGTAYTNNPVETARGPGTHTGPTMDNVVLISTQKISFDVHMLAYEGVLGGFALPIGWDLKFTFDMSNPAQPKVNLSGSRTGFPAFEIYVGNSAQDNLPLYQWTPPSNRTVWSLGVIEPVEIPQPLQVP
jgi:hypothetical protein